MKKIITISLMALSLFGSTNNSIKSTNNLYFFDFQNHSCVNEGKNYDKFKENLNNKIIVEKDREKDLKLSLYKYSILTEENKEDIFISSETKESCEEYKKMYIRMLMNSGNK